MNGFGCLKAKPPSVLKVVHSDATVAGNQKFTIMLHKRGISGVEFKNFISRIKASKHNIKPIEELLSHFKSTEKSAGTNKSESKEKTDFLSMGVENDKEFYVESEADIQDVSYNIEELAIGEYYLLSDLERYRKLLKKYKKNITEFYKKFENTYFVELKDYSFKTEGKTIKYWRQESLLEVGKENPTQFHSLLSGTELPLDLKWPSWSILVGSKGQLTSKYVEADYYDRLVKVVDTRAERELMMRLPQVINRGTKQNSTFFQCSDYSSGTTASVGHEKLYSLGKALTTHFRGVEFYSEMYSFAAFLLQASGGDELDTFNFLVKYLKDCRFMFHGIYEEHLPLLGYINSLFHALLRNEDPDLEIVITDIRFIDELWLNPWTMSMYTGSFPPFFSSKILDFILSTDVLSIPALNVAIIKEMRSLFFSTSDGVILKNKIMAFGSDPIFVSKLDEIISDAQRLRISPNNGLLRGEGYLLGNNNSSWAFEKYANILKPLLQAQIDSNNKELVPFSCLYTSLTNKPNDYELNDSKEVVNIIRHDNIKSYYHNEIQGEECYFSENIKEKYHFNNKNNNANNANEATNPKLDSEHAEKSLPAYDQEANKQSTGKKTFLMNFDEISDVKPVVRKEYTEGGAEILLFDRQFIESDSMNESNDNLNSNRNESGLSIYDNENSNLEVEDGHPNNIDRDDHYDENNTSELLLEDGSNSSGHRASSKKFIQINIADASGQMINKDQEKEKKSCGILSHNQYIPESIQVKNCGIKSKSHTKLMATGGDKNSPTEPNRIKTAVRSNQQLPLSSVSSHQILVKTPNKNNLPTGANTKAKAILFKDSRINFSEMHTRESRDNKSKVSVLMAPGLGKTMSLHPSRIQSNVMISSSCDDGINNQNEVLNCQELRKNTIEDSNPQLNFEEIFVEPENNELNKEGSTSKKSMKYNENC